MRLIHFLGFSLEKCGKIWKNRPFFRADMAGLGKYCMGGYGRIGVFRVNVVMARNIVCATFKSLPEGNVVYALLSEDRIRYPYFHESRLCHTYMYAFLVVPLLESTVRTIEIS